MNYLTERYAELCRSYPEIKQMNIMRDDKGMYAVVFTRIRSDKAGANHQVTAYFVAKRNMAGHLVSVHKELFNEARKNQRAIVMAVGEAYYQFMPHKLTLKQFTENRRHGTDMINFGIEHGTKVSPPKPEEQTLFEQGLAQHPVVKELQTEFGARIV